MTANYRNSEGTDLDNLFYVNNSNAGAIGFKVSGGQDLGNRYASGSLGYAVGYKNSAGTDLGYLRGSVVAPTANVNISFSGSYVDRNEVIGSEQTEVTRTTTGTIYANVKITNGAPFNVISWTLEARRTNARHDNILIKCGWNGSTNYSDEYLIRQSYDRTNWCTIGSETVNKLSQSVMYYSKSQSLGITNEFWTSVDIRLKVTISNAAGSTTVYSNTVNIYYGYG